MKLSTKQAQRPKNKYGEWALVTGATSGIGRELATKLAEGGFNVIITGRRKALLDELAADLFSSYRSEVLPITGDLSTPEGVQELIHELDDAPVGLAILNAGFGTSGQFHESSLEAEVNMLRLDCEALMVMTHYFSRRFVKEGKGGIVLLSSMVAFQGVPKAAHYAATKTYVQSFGEAIARELKPHGVDVLCAAPGPVESDFSGRANMRMNGALTPDLVGVPILKAIGKQTNVLPGFMTKFLVYSLRMLPRWGKIRVLETVMGGFTKHQQVA